MLDSTQFHFFKEELEKIALAKIADRYVQDIIANSILEKKAMGVGVTSLKLPTGTTPTNAQAPKPSTTSKPLPAPRVPKMPKFTANKSGTTPKPSAYKAPTDYKAPTFSVGTQPVPPPLTYT